MEIKHVVVLMLENRSFDCMLGWLYHGQDKIDGLDGTQQNPWHRPDGTASEYRVWSSEAMTSQAACIPNPDPGESYADINMQIQGMQDARKVNPGAPTMTGFVDNYMRQTVNKGDPPLDPGAVMHFFTPDELPAMKALAEAFAVSDRWHASAPNQTWPNRFFAHTGTAAGYINNTPTHFPYTMETVFNRLDSAGVSWRVYFHDIPQAATLARLWLDIPTHFRFFEAEFADHAAAGTLPAYSFIEPRYFTDPVLQLMPNDQHPPHNVSHGDALIGRVYNALRAGPGWPNTLLIVTYDEHGGCYDHVPPPAAVPPDDLTPCGVVFDRFGVRVPALIVSPWVQPGSVLRPAGATPFDHTSIIATLRKLHGFEPLTKRDAAAPNLIDVLNGDGSNLGPVTVPVQEPAPTADAVAASVAHPPNPLQHALNGAAIQLPTAGADIAAHIARIAVGADPLPSAAAGVSAAETIGAHIKAFLGLA